MLVSHLYPYMYICIYIFNFVRQCYISFAYKNQQQYNLHFSILYFVVFHSSIANCLLSLNSWKIAPARSGGKWSITFFELDLLQVLLASTALLVFCFSFCLIYIRILACMRSCYCGKPYRHLLIHIYKGVCI